MPYYVYRVKPFAQLHKIAEYAAFRDASARAKAERAAPDADRAATVRVMFAASERLAEDLLCQVRDPVPGTGDDG